MTVVAIGGLTGGGGRLLGPMVAAKLDADYVDRLILTRAAPEVGATVAALHQREERAPTRAGRFSGFLHRVLERSAVSGVSGDPYFGPGSMAFLTEEFEAIPPQPATRGHEVEDEAYIEAIRRVIQDMAASGNVVLVGRGASIILKDEPQALRVGAVADVDDRVARIMERDQLDREQAEQVVSDRDEARAHYFRRFFGIEDPDDPHLYHMVINTSEVDLEYAANVVADAARALGERRLAASSPHP